MRKSLFIFGTIVVISVLLLSCSKTNTCKCVHNHNDGSYSESLYNPDAENVKSCSQLENKLNAVYGDGLYSCSKL